jgi:hypothetical protein
MKILFDNENALVRAIRALAIGAVSVGITAIANALTSGELAIPTEAAWLVPLITSALLGIDKFLRRP